MTGAIEFRHQDNHLWQSLFTLSTEEYQKLIEDCAVGCLHTTMTLAQAEMLETIGMLAILRSAALLPYNYSLSDYLEEFGLV